jgi:hypothetical protein
MARWKQDKSIVECFLSLAGAPRRRIRPKRRFVHVESHLKSALVPGAQTKKPL